MKRKDIIPNTRFMKHAILFLFLFLAGAGLYAQAPGGFRFQAVARDADNDVMATDNIAVRVSLLRGGPSGAVGYAERHEVTTTDLGVFDLHIGNGTSLSGDINTIDWGTDSYFLKIDIDPDGGTSYVNMGASQLLSVPYALYAKESGSGGGDDPTDELQNLVYDPVTQTLTLTDGNSVTLQIGGGGGGTDDQTISLSGTTLSIEGGNTVDLSVLQDGVDDADADPTNEIQNLSFNVATNELSIAGGNTITIPSGGTDADADPTNELQTITIAGDQLSLSNGGGTVTIPGGGGTDNQTLTFNPATNELTISGGNTITIPSGGTDADADPTNEIQTITISGATISLSDGGGSLDLTPLLSTINTDDADADPSNELQSLSFNAGTNELSLSDGGGTVTIPTGGTDADADPTNELQTITKTGNTVTLSDGGGSFTDEVADADADPANELQALSLSGNNLTLSNGGGTVTLPEGGSTDLELPYYDEASVPGAAFHVQNDFFNGRYGIAGTAGDDAEDLPDNNAGVFGQGSSAHGVYGRSMTSFYAGVQGVSVSPEGVGVQGYGVGGGVGGHFYTTPSGIAALTTGRGNVGIGIDEPEMKMHVGGDLFVQTNLGELVMGFPNNGNQWQFSTRGSGADLQFQHKPSGTNSFLTKFRLRQDGEFQVGDLGTPSAWMHVANNSNINKPHLKLEEVGNDYARLELTNNAASGAYWHVAGLPSATASSARLNFYFRNTTGAADRMTITGDGEVGINGTPTARLHVHQRSQTVGTGLRFSDNTANQDWDVTHGFALRFHYGGALRGFINATTGAYTQSSDKTLKTNIASITPVLNRVRNLAVKTYSYKSDTTNEMTLGLLAQDARELFPELVSYSAVDKLYGVNYAGFSMVAVKAIQEQQEIIEQQETKINNLEARLARLEALLIADKPRE